MMQMTRHAAAIAALALTLAGPGQASAQALQAAAALQGTAVDLSGTWANRLHEDWIERAPGPHIGDYTGLPINDEARAVADAYQVSMQNMPERQCILYTSQYIVMGPQNLRIQQELDPIVGTVVAYHLIGEGVVARVSTTLSTPVFERLGTFPGILMGQRLVSRDESRHIGIGVTYARREMTRDPARTLRLVDEVLQHSMGRFVEVLGMATDGLAQAVAEHYGATPQEYFLEASRLIGVRLRSIGAGALVAPGS